MARLVRRPVLSVIKGDNADLMAQVARLYIRSTDEVLDITYGRGLFWKKYDPPYLVAWTGDFLKTPFPKKSFDVVVYDPPYTSTGTKSKTTIPDFYDRYGVGDIKGWKALFKLNALGLAEVADLSKRLVMVKTADYVESGHRRWGHDATVETAKELGLKRVDEFILFSGTGAQPKKNLDGTRRRQVHSRRAHSFLCIFKV